MFHLLIEYFLSKLNHSGLIFMYMFQKKQGVFKCGVQMDLS